MTEMLPLFDGEDDASDHGDGDRRDRTRSLITVAVVLLFAVAVAGLAVLGLRSPHHGKPDKQLGAPTDVITFDSSSPSANLTTPVASSTSAAATPSLTASTSASSTSPSAPKTTQVHGSSTHAPSTPAPSTPPSTASTTQCAGCSIGGDGGAVAALNAYRRARHLPPVTGRVTTEAQSCATSLSIGGTLYCRAPFASGVTRSQNGEQAVAAAIANGTGRWFTGAVSSVDVGWAYDGAGRYYCVLFED